MELVNTAMVAANTPVLVLAANTPNGGPLLDKLPKLGHNVCYVYRSLVKEHPPPTLGLISCIVKMYSNKCLPWRELHVEF